MVLYFIEFTPMSAGTRATATANSETCKITLGSVRQKDKTRGSCIASYVVTGSMFSYIVKILPSKPGIANESPVASSSHRGVRV